MDFARVWPRNGDAKFSAGDARRDGSDSRYSFRRNTPAPEPGSHREDYRFPRRQRLTLGAELQSVGRAGARAGSGSLAVRAVITSRGFSRVGVVVPKYRHTAVRRNQLKRALRELTRLVLLPALRSATAVSDLDVVMRVRPNAYDVSPEKLRAEIEEVKGRLLRLRIKAVGNSREIENGSPLQPEE